MPTPQEVKDAIINTGKFNIKLNNVEEVSLTEDDLIFEYDKLWFLTKEQKAKGVRIVKWDGKDCDELITN